MLMFCSNQDLERKNDGCEVTVLDCLEVTVPVVWLFCSHCFVVVVVVFLYFIQ